MRRYLFGKYLGPENVLRFPFPFELFVMLSIFNYVKNVNLD